MLLKDPQKPIFPESFYQGFTKVYCNRRYVRYFINITSILHINALLEVIIEYGGTKTFGIFFLVFYGPVMCWESRHLAMLVFFLQKMSITFDVHQWTYLKYLYSWNSPPSIRWAAETNELKESNFYLNVLKFSLTFFNWACYFILSYSCNVMDKASSQKETTLNKLSKSIPATCLENWETVSMFYPRPWTVN